MAERPPYLCGKCGPVYEDADRHQDRHRFEAVLDSMLLEMSGAPKQLWWLSFCDTHLPAGEQFLGVCIVDAVDMFTAVRESHRLGCNPGGEVLGWPVSERTEEHGLASAVIGRLLDKDAMAAAGFGTDNLGDLGYE